MFTPPQRSVKKDTAAPCPFGPGPGHRFPELVSVLESEGSGSAAGLLGAGGGWEWGVSATLRPGDLKGPKATHGGRTWTGLAGAPSPVALGRGRVLSPEVVRANHRKVAAFQGGRRGQDHPIFLTLTPGQRKPRQIQRVEPKGPGKLRRRRGPGLGEGAWRGPGGAG